MRRVADEAGISRSKVQHYFPRRESLLQDVRDSESEKLFVEIWSLATRDPIGREVFDRMYSHHRHNLARLVTATNPALDERTAQQRAALIVMQIEGLMLLISEGKPQHAELQGLEEECVAALMRLVDAPVVGGGMAG